MFDLSQHGADTFVGSGPLYPWGGLFGGQIVAQALAAAARTVEPEFPVHSLRAYFIRRGTASEPIRFEVDRTRNGRSFVTRRVIARQAVGAILNLEASFQRVEASWDIETIAMPDVPAADSLPEDSWSEAFERRMCPAGCVRDEPGAGTGGVASWFRSRPVPGEPSTPATDLLHRCWFAYVSDDLPTDSARAALAGRYGSELADQLTGASLDHTLWFHRPFRADEWILHVVRCQRFVGSRGLTLGHAFTPDGVHVATYAQEVLLRPRRNEPAAT